MPHDNSVALGQPIVITLEATETDNVFIFLQFDGYSHSLGTWHLSTFYIRVCMKREIRF